MNKRGVRAAIAAHYSIKATALATGLSVEVLRAWERRYGAVTPNRDSAGRRSYSAADVARLRLLRSATELGHPIGRAAVLSVAELEMTVAEAGGIAQSLVARGQSYVERALRATLQSDSLGVEEVLLSAMLLLPANEVAHNVIAPLVREVGIQWHAGELSIAQEHMVTDIVKRLLIAASRGYFRSANSSRLVLATLSGERHEVGLLLCNWLAATRRHHVHYLGADCPPEEIARFAIDVKARAALISIVMPENIVAALTQLRKLAAALSGHCEIWIGGHAAGQLPSADLPAGCSLVSSVADFEQRLDLLDS